MTDVTEQQRPVRMCDTCGGVDDHPRHVHGVAPGQEPTRPEIARIALDNAHPADRDEIMRQVMDRSTQVKHLDCCASDGCPDGSCNTIHADSPGETDGRDPAGDAGALRGQALLEHLTSGAVDHVGVDLNNARLAAAEAEAAAQGEEQP